MHYNPFAYIHSEKDILKLVTTLIANTKGDGKAGDEFWTKAETLLYCYSAFCMVPPHHIFSQIKIRYTINYSDREYIRLIYAVPFVLS